MSRIWYVVLAVSAIIIVGIVWFGTFPQWSFYTEAWRDQAIVALDWVEKHQESVNALSTILIAVFTGTLWWATAGLKNFAQIQSEDMKASIRVTQELAKAAQRSADVAETSARHFEGLAK